MSQAQPAVSVLLVSYNGEPYIAEQLSSIRDQSRPVDEVVIADDGSSDQTLATVNDLISRSGLSHWLVRRNPSNLGVAENVLAHLGDVHGDLVFLADQDDVWEPERVAVMCQVMRDHPEIVMLTCRTRQIDRAGEPSPVGWRSRVGRMRRGAGWRELTFDDFVGTSQVPMHAMLLRRDLLEAVRQLPNVPTLSNSVGADWLIGIMATLRGRCVELPQTLIRRRVHGGNVSLQRLHKTTVLSTTKALRQMRMSEALQAHRFLAASGACSPDRHPVQRVRLEAVIDLLDRRWRFGDDPSVGQWLALGRRLGTYWLVGDGWVLGTRLWITDLMYAYGINWGLLRRPRAVLRGG